MTDHHVTMHVHQYNYMNTIGQLKSLHDAAYLSTGYKTSGLRSCSPIFLRVVVKLFHSTVAELTRLKLAKMVMASVLVLAA